MFGRSMLFLFALKGNLEVNTKVRVCGVPEERGQNSLSTLSICREWMAVTHCSTVNTADAL